MKKVLRQIVTEAQKEELVRRARRAAAAAYCPYSKYPVGAAVLGEDGVVYDGCNVENASFGLTMCAERVAAFKAVAAGNRLLAALAVAGGTASRPAQPCGACRQVLAEFGEPEMPVLVAGRTGRVVTATTLGALLPLTFHLREAR